MKERIAIVNQRYGAEVNGGSEYYTKKLAEQLGHRYNVEVLTTTALDHDTWKPYYVEGIETVNGVKVRRFAIERSRNLIWFKIINRLLVNFPFMWRVLEPIWLKAQGPYCPELIRYIRNAKDDYYAFVFVTYLYYTTVAGLPEVFEKAIFVPTAHDEYCISFHMYQKLFCMPKAIVYLSEEESHFIRRLFKNEGIPSEVAGSGIELTEFMDETAFREKYHIDKDYIIYVGRVEQGKNCRQLFDYFCRFNESEMLNLLVVGKIMMDLPDDKNIIFTGYVSEDEKNTAIKGAKVLILPSEHESLSLAVLEALYLGVPVVVNGCCEVLAGHCRRSMAGLCYSDYSTFAEALKILLTDSQRYDAMKKNGQAYIEENYNWHRTIEKYSKLIEE